MSFDTQAENERVRITRWTLEPGESTGPHTHELDYVVVPVIGGTQVVTGPDGDVLTREIVTGQAYFREAGATHSVHNGGSETLVFVETELFPHRGDA
ncbi:MAG: beta-alanine degradation protein BauB [Subtercola sp.]|nr:beta-alanine degradation protein BauB [Subtercola sp.]